MFSADRRAQLLTAPFLGIAALAGFLIAAASLRALQLTLGVVLVLAAFTIDKHAKGMPAVLRPAPLIMLSALVGSVSTGLLTSGEYEGAYVWMWLCQIAGFLLAIFLFGDLNKSIGAARRPANIVRLRRYALGVWWLGTTCAAVFFGMKGVPLLEDSIEQGRVDVATSGTGYLRLLAFMTGPAAILIFATSHRRRWLYLLATAGLIVLFANRSPLVYLGVPLVAMAAVADTRVKSRHLIAAGLVALVGVGALGTYRLMNQPEFRSYQEYRTDLAQGDTVGVAYTSITHYARVVPANAVLVKRLVDDEKITRKMGATYLTLFISAMPGEQLSPDMTIKRASGKDFIGGGTPPTLMGEGYMNFGYPGIVIGSFVVMWLARYSAAAAIATQDRAQRKINAGLYGYVITWCCMAQVGGLAGAATIPLAGFLLLIGLRSLTPDRASGTAGDRAAAKDCAVSP